MQKGIDFLDRYVTNTATIGLGVTLTLPAPATGGGFHMIRRIDIFRFAAAALTAAATPVIITSTNMPGSWAKSIPADALAQGVATEQIYELSIAIKSLSAETDTTFIAPATTDVIWRLTVHYTHSQARKA